MTLRVVASWSLNQHPTGYRRRRVRTCMTLKEPLAEGFRVEEPPTVLIELVL